MPAAEPSSLPLASSASDEDDDDDEEGTLEICSASSGSDSDAFELEHVPLPEESHLITAYGRGPFEPNRLRRTPRGSTSVGISASASPASQSFSSCAQNFILLIRRGLFSYGTPAMSAS